MLIAGDMLLPRISTNVSRVARSSPTAIRSRASSIRSTRFEALPADTLVLPSHGLPFRGIAAARRAACARITPRGSTSLQHALAAAPRPQSAAEIVPVLFRRELDLQQRFFAMGEAIAHLNHLWHARPRQRSVATDGAIRFAA